LRARACHLGKHLLCLRICGLLASDAFRRAARIAKG
jgi:hypothetical protein